MSRYKRFPARFSLVKEKGGLRIVDAVKDDPIAETFAIDTPEEGAVPIMRSTLKKVKQFTVGGSRQVNNVSSQGYDQIDVSITHYLQTCRIFYATLWNCVTTGTSYSPVIQDSIASGQGTKTLTFSTITSLVVDAHKGDMLVVDSGDAVGFKYYIVSNTADSVTVDIDTHPAINSDVVEIKTVPFTHTITRGDQPVTFAAHFDIPARDGDAAKRIIVDALGVIVKSATVSIAPDGDAIIEANYLGAKSIDGDVITNPENLAIRHFKWGHASTFYVSYNAVNKIVQYDCESLEILLDNDTEIRKHIGDFYPDREKDGIAEDTVTITHWPKDKTFHDLVNVDTKDYTGPIALRVILTQEKAGLNPDGITFWDRTIQIDISKLFVNDFPEEIPSKDDDDMAADMELFDDVGNVTQVAGVDELGIEYYEGSTPYVAP
jgi:hypothetical protein